MNEIENAIEHLNERLRYAVVSTAIDVDVVKLAIKALEAQQADMWIPASDRLPEKNGNYMVTVKNLTGHEIVKSEVFECCYAYEEWNFPEWRDNKVIAWKPLPEPYKEEAYA